VSTPPVTVSPAGIQTEKVGRREKGKDKRRERGAKVEEEDEVMKDGSDDAGIDWRPYEDLSSYEDEDTCCSLWHSCTRLQVIQQQKPPHKSYELIFFKFHVVEW